MQIWLRRKMVSMLLAAAITTPVLITGQLVHGQDYDHQSRQADPDSRYYRRWERETHRRHEAWERRKREEQREYWEWQRNYDREHHRDHYRDRDDHDHDNDRH